MIDAIWEDALWLWSNYVAVGVPERNLLVVSIAGLVGYVMGGSAVAVKLDTDSAKAAGSLLVVLAMSSLCALLAYHFLPLKADSEAMGALAGVVVGATLGVILGKLVMGKSFPTVVLCIVVGIICALFVGYAANAIMDLLFGAADNSPGNLYSEISSRSLIPFV